MNFDYGKLQAGKFQYASGESPLAGYVIRRGIGIGGFGEVYFAESDSGKEVALKRIQKNLDVEMRGVRHCLNLRHPNLVSIYDIRYDDEQQGWIVMEFIEGESLRDHLDRNMGTHSSGHHTFEHTYEDGSPDKVIPIFAQVVSGTTYLHDQGIVHRDLKPANIFLEKGLAKIGDYGLSKYISTSRRAGQTDSVGTFHYMAPEIGKGEYGKEIDIYSLGIILYEMLTGTVPFDGESTQEILLKHLTADPDLSMIPPSLSPVIAKCLAKNPTQRFRDGRDLLSALGYELTSAGFATTKQPVRWTPSTIGQATNFSGGDAKPSASAFDSDAKRNRERETNAARTGKPLTLSERLSAFFTIGIDGHKSMLEREPLFRICRDILRSIGKSLHLPVEDSPFYLSVLIIAALLWFVTLATSLFSLYALYYVIWFFANVTQEDVLRAKSNLETNQSPGEFAGVPEVPTRSRPVVLADTASYTPSPSAHRNEPVRTKSKPLSAKESAKIWKSQQRQLLAVRNSWISLHDWLQSMTFSGVIASVTAIAGGYFATSSGFLKSASSIWSPEALGGVAWLGSMSILCSWAIITFSRRWESRPEDSIAFRFAMMVTGLILGAISYQVSEFLLVPWGSISNSSTRILVAGLEWKMNRTWEGFYDSNGLPTLAGHMAYFACLMWGVRWWRQSDSLRKKKFSLWSVVWSVLIAALVQFVFYFPPPWPMWLAAIISLTVQIASPWLDPSHPPADWKPQNGVH